MAYHEETRKYHKLLILQYLGDDESLEEVKREKGQEDQKKMIKKDIG